MGKTNRESNLTGRRIAALAAIRAIYLVLLCPIVSLGTVIETKSGLEFQGVTDSVSSIGVDVLHPSSIGGPVDVEPIVVIDDGLRRTFISKQQVANLRPDVETLERIRLKQNVVLQGNVIGRIGDIVRVTPFDNHGHRTFTSMSPKGPLNVIQGITEVTPVWSRIQGLRVGQPYVWDMRIATSSIPRDQLRTILSNYLDEDDADVRLSIVQLYLQAERYGEAEQELREAIRDFPKLARLKQQLKELRQLRSKQQLGEIKLRQESGQHRLAADLLTRFPDEDVAGEILLEVSELIEAATKQRDKKDELLAKLKEQFDSIEEAAKRETLDPFLEELTTELNENTFSRMADYQRLLLDKELKDEQKIALAISGWLLGGEGTENIEVAISLWPVRKLVRAYLLSSTIDERQRIIAELASLEGGSPKYIARILATMKPPVKTKGLEYFPKADEPADESVAPDGEKPGKPSDEQPDIDGLFELTTDGVELDGKRSPIRYIVQLPPEYDPNRRYPAIVTLHAAGAGPHLQIDWWSGSHNTQLGMRLGQASRRGYIVIAPDWAKPRQKQYKYTAQEHAAALFSLRDAMQRFSIDTNQVFLSGHGMGGDAAWDIGLAHPDLWAGVLPVGAVAEYETKNAPKYISRYWSNGRHIPMYFVGGAFDGKKIDTNARDWNRYLKKSGFDVTIVEYLGRGNEHFQDEIQRMFKWMEYHPRNFWPEEINVSSMRPWDRFFWWLEVDGMPPKSMVLPAAWPARSAVRPTVLEASINNRSNLFIKAGTEEVTLWLSPEMVDLNGVIKLRFNGKTKKVDTKPKTEVILEDARQRGDRLHPFWVKVELKKAQGRR